MSHGGTGPLKVSDVLDDVGECLNYIAFMDENDSEFVKREFGGDQRIITSVAMVQDILSDLYDMIEERGIA